eukprot:2793571-Pyramimonas_sp.AAC.1
MSNSLPVSGSAIYLPLVAPVEVECWQPSLPVSGVLPHLDAATRPRIVQEGGMVTSINGTMCAR